MTKRVEFLKHLVARLQDPENKSIAMSMEHCHVRGVFSLVIDGEEHGRLTRVFIASRKIKPFEIQLHSHAYGLRITPLTNRITQHEARIAGDNPIRISQYKYQSPLNGGNGLEYDKDVNVSMREFVIPVGSTVRMGSHEIHTISCAKGSMWIVEELGFDTKDSRVLGVPFITDCLYIQPGQFQINDKVVLVLNKLKELIRTYEQA